MPHRNPTERTVKAFLAVVICLGLLAWPQANGQASPQHPTSAFDTDATKKTVFMPFISMARTPAIALSQSGSAWYAAPNGSSGGNGSQEKPWDLSTALSHPSSVKPGDTIWLRGGVYGKGGSQEYKSRLQGKEGAFITVRAVPGERATIDGAIQVYGSWSIFWGLEVMNSDPDRLSSQDTSSPSDVARQGGFQVYAANTKFINNIVHDTKSGFGIWEEAVNAEAYGNLVYNNGWKGPDRMHGHGLYSQNSEGTKRIVENIIFSNFSNYGVHIYTEGSSLTGYHFEGNIHLNDEFLIGGLQPADRITLIGNHHFGNRTRIGYKAQNGNLTLKDNWFGTVDFASLELKWWKKVAASGNTIWNLTRSAVELLSASGGSTFDWNNNSYSGQNGSPFTLDNASLGWDQWRRALPGDQNSSFQNTKLTGVNVFVRPNAYQPKRGHIIVYNWDQNSAVSVDISGLGLAPGETYVLRNAQNYYDETITGTYNGQPISIPMQGWSLAKPVGWNTPLDNLTFPLFGAFVVEVQ